MVFQKMPRLAIQHLYLGRLLASDRRTDGRTDGQTDGQTDGRRANFLERYVFDNHPFGVDKVVFKVLRPALPAASQSCCDRTIACVYTDLLALIVLARASYPALLRRNATAMKDSTQQSFRRQHRSPNSPLHFHREKFSRGYHADRGTQHLRRLRKH